MRAAELLLVLETNTAGLISGLQQARSVLGGFLGAIDKGAAFLGKFWLAAEGAKMAVDAIERATRVATDFETALAKVSLQLDASARMNLPVYREELLKMSTQFGYSASDLASALAEILDAGISASKSLSVLEVASKLARAGFTDLKTTTDVLLQVLNAYGLGAESAQRVSDVLFKTALIGRTSIEELAPAFSKVAALAAAAGIPLEEVAAAFAVLTSQGVSTADATNGLTIAIDAIISPSMQAAEAAEKLGIGMSAAELKAKGLAGFIERLAASDAGIDAIAQLFPSARGIRAIETLKSAALDFGKTVQEMYAAAGATQEAFGIATDTTAFKWEQFRQTMQRFLIDIITPLLPLLTTLMEVLKPIAEILGLILGTIIKIVAQPIIWILKGIVALQTAIKEAIFGRERATEAIKEETEAMKGQEKVVRQVTQATQQQTVEVGKLLKELELKRREGTISAEEELAQLQKVRDEARLTSQEKIELLNQIEKVSAEVLDSELRNIEYQRHLEQMTAEEELAALQKILETHTLTTEKRMDLEKRVFDLQKRIRDDRVKEMIAIADWEVAMGKRTAEERIALLKRILDTEVLTAEKRRELILKIHEEEKRIEEEQKRRQEERLRDLEESARHDLSMGRLTQSVYLERLKEMAMAAGDDEKAKRRILEEIYRVEKAMIEERVRSAIAAADALVEDEGLKARLRIDILKEVAKQYRKGTTERIQLEEEILKEETALMRRERDERRRWLEETEGERLKRVKENLERLRELSKQNWDWEADGAERLAKIKMGLDKTAMVAHEEAVREFRKRFLSEERLRHSADIAGAIEFAKKMEETEGLSPAAKAEWAKAREALMEQYKEIRKRELGWSEKASKEEQERAQQAAEEDAKRISGAWTKSADEQRKAAEEAHKEVISGLEDLREKSKEIARAFGQAWVDAFETVRAGLRGLIDEASTALEILRRITGGRIGGLPAPIMRGREALQRVGAAGANVFIDEVKIGWIGGYTSARQAASEIARILADEMQERSWYYGAP